MGNVLPYYKYKAANRKTQTHTQHKMAVNDSTDFTIKNSTCTLDPEKLSNIELLNNPKRHGMIGMKAKEMRDER